MKVLLVVAIALPLAAQTKQSGTAKCAAPNPMHSLDVGDRPGHALTVAKGKCEWTKAIEMEGLKGTTGESTETGEVSGNTARANGIFVGAMNNGDKYTVRYQSNTTMKDGKPVSQEGKWNYVSGTGKLRGLKGSGTLKGTAQADGSMIFEVEGEYSITPPAKK